MKTLLVQLDCTGFFGEKNLAKQFHSYSLGYIHALCVIQWGLTYLFPSVNAISEKLITYLLYSALYPCKYCITSTERRTRWELTSM